MKSEPFKILISKEDAHLRLDQVLKRHRPHVPYSLLQKAFRTGRVRLNECRVKHPGERVKAGDTVLLFGTYQETTPQKAPLENPLLLPFVAQVPEWIVYEDEALLILNKPTGLATQAGTKTTVSLDRILTLYAADAYIPRLTHRLDKDTSGILIVAKTRGAAHHITRQFRDGEIQKTYWACVVGGPSTPEGKIETPLGKMTGAQKEKMSSQAAVTHAAVTTYKVSCMNEKHALSWLVLRPHTGRTHQLRVHCAEEGFPILGDGKYGGRSAHPFEHRVPLCLHARELTFSHPEGTLKTVTAPMHEAMQEIMKTYFPTMKES